MPASEVILHTEPTTPWSTRAPHWTKWQWRCKEDAEEDIINFVINYKDLINSETSTDDLSPRLLVKLNVRVAK